MHAKETGELLDVIDKELVAIIPISYFDYLSSATAEMR
jgi:hypothetical protein